ncbi:putative membrane protein [Gordonia polyisoprenivorans VH2]|uniref:Putative membrane protein n=1 Tax=Gordonia polyisoprenivorans (strain DSM 44266 / VH2) TaxID=1112204 RepID=H6N473_GORPV|nr:hypothetical protein [Gordonia polyisoprenivorans]AFA71220.1 putative membrane protein [Gordonia polyisoprenivorans VH2]
MNALLMILGLAPWFVFSLVAQNTGDNVALAAGVACAIAFAMAAWGAFRGRSWKILDVTAIAVFGILAVVGLFAGDQLNVTLTNFARGGLTFVLAAIMLISAFTIPFTEQYARESVDPALWHSPIFREKNRRISLLWAGAVFLMGCSHVVAGVLADNAAPGTAPGNVILNWVIPIVLIVLAVKQTQRIAGAQVPATATTTSSHQA